MLWEDKRLSDFVISENTRNSISTINAPRPKLDPRDPNIGKIALVKEGAYKGLKGIIYPPTKELKYDGEFVKGFTGHYEVEKLYHVMFFFEDGPFFCAMETDLMDLEVEGGIFIIDDGDGTVAKPYGCGERLYTSVPEIYHELPLNKSGYIIINTYQSRRVDSVFKVFWINDLTTPIGQTHTRVHGVVFNSPHDIIFYYDPRYNPNKIVIKNDYIGNWYHKVNCLTELDGSIFKPYICGTNIVLNSPIDMKNCFFQLIERTGEVEVVYKYLGDPKSEASLEVFWQNEVIGKVNTKEKNYEEKSIIFSVDEIKMFNPQVRVTVHGHWEVKVKCPVNKGISKLREKNF